MAISEATFGAVGNSHGLVAASPGAANYTSHIVGRTDLPSSASGAEWQPFESGFFDQGCFFLSRTWPDPTAGRGGMVFTHTLVAPWAEVEVPDGLARLQAMLPLHMDRTRPLQDRQLASARAAPPSAHAQGLLDLMLKPKPPIVWIGESGLCDVLASLWPHLPPDLRPLIGFRLSFGAENAAILPRLVATPASLAHRWSGRSILDPRVPAPAPSSVAVSLLNEPSAQKIREYGTRFGVRPRSFDEWAMLQQISAIVEAEGESLASLLMQLRFLVVLSPQPDEGANAKSSLAAKVAGALSHAPANQVSAMRNLNLSAWPSADAVWQGVRRWSAAHAGVEGAGDVECLWTQALESGNAELAWRHAVLAGFDDGAKSGDAAFWRAWWRRWSATPDLIAPLFERLPKRRKTEIAITDVAPHAIDKEVADVLLDEAAAKGWLVLHANVAVRSRPLPDALELQLSVDTDQADPSALAAMVVGQDAATVVAMAVRFGDARLVRFAGEAASREHSLLASFDMRSPFWRRILQQALTVDSEAWRGLGDLDAARKALISLLANDAMLDDGFVAAISLTDLADMSVIADRSALWVKLAGSERQRFIQRTARGWLVEFAAGRGNAADIESELHAAVTTHPVAIAHLEFEGKSPEAALRYLEAFPDAPQDAALGWLQRLKHSGGTLEPGTAERLGRLLNQRHWTRAASALASIMHRDGGSLFAPAAFFLRSMLQFTELQRLWVRGVIAPDGDDEVWRMLEDVAARLYPGGPNDSALWSSAGGDPSDLPFGRSGRTQWHNTLRDVRHGRHDIGANELLLAMTADHPHNSELRWLAKQKALRDG